MSRWRVFLGFVAGAAFAAFSHVASWERMAIGLAISFLGLLLRGWAAGYLEKGKRLAQDGPYSYWRHPLYGGSFLMAVGFCLAGTGSSRTLHGAVLWVAFCLLFFGVYPPRVKEEESSLEKHFGEPWREYVRNTHRFWPRFSPLRRADPDRFLWSRYLKNQEYNATFGWLAGCALLVTKGIFGF